MRHCCHPTVNVGGYIQAVLDRNLAENISRVLYPNDNVSDTSACIVCKYSKAESLLCYVSHYIIQVLLYK